MPAAAHHAAPAPQLEAATQQIPTPAAGGEPAAPVEAMAGLSVSQPQYRREERERKPTVSRRGQPGKAGGEP
jgi:hypothetical protein